MTKRAADLTVSGGEQWPAERRVEKPDKEPEHCDLATVGGQEPLRSRWDAFSSPGALGGGVIGPEIVLWAALCAVWQA